MEQEMADRMLRIGVLLGGHSAEREVSLESGSCVAESLRGLGHTVVCLDPAYEPIQSLNGRVDVILPMLHGTGAEDGSLQRVLESMKIPWLGSSADASVLTFDKGATRDRLVSVGLSVPPGRLFDASDFPQTVMVEIDSLGWPLVIKPAAQGSSVGISIVRQSSELHEAIAEALKWGETYLVEKYIPGRELTVPVIEGTAFPVVEIIPSRPWYDYTAKYSDEKTQYLVDPPGVPKDMVGDVVKACTVCGVTGISRTDLRVDPDGQFWILEINTIPGMTSHSLVPMSIRARGWTVGKLLENLLMKKVTSKQH